MISKLGAIRTDIKKPVKFVTQKGKDVITDSMQRNGIQWDNLGQISGKRVNAFLDDIKGVAGKGVKKVNPDDTFEYLAAHGASQIKDASSKPIFQYVENVKNPVKEAVKSVINMVRK